MAGKVSEEIARRESAGEILKPRLSQLFTGIIIAILLSLSVTAQTCDASIIDTFNEYKELPDRIKAVESMTEDAMSQVHDLQTQVQDLETQAQDLARQKQDLEMQVQELTRQNQDLNNQLNYYQESQRSSAPLYVGMILMIVALVVILSFLIRRKRNVGKK